MDIDNIVIVVMDRSLNASILKELLPEALIIKSYNPRHGMVIDIGEQFSIRISSLDLAKKMIEYIEKSKATINLMRKLL